MSTGGELRFGRHLIPSIPAGRNALVIICVALLLAVVSAVALVSVLTSERAGAPAPIARPVDASDAYQAVRESNGRDGAPLALVKGVPLFPLPTNGSLKSYEGAPVEAQGIRVQSIAANGMWIGDAADQRVWLSIPADISSRDKISVENLKPGDAVNVSGRFSGLNSDPQSMGLVSTGDADTLGRQDEMLVANGIRMAKSDGKSASH